MNHEIVREALFYDGVEVEIRTAKDNNRNQIEDINYFIDRKVDLLIVAPNEAAAVTPVVEKAYGLGIPVVVIDRKICRTVIRLLWVLIIVRLAKMWDNIL